VTGLGITGPCRAGTAIVVGELVEVKTGRIVENPEFADNVVVRYPYSPTLVPLEEQLI